MARAQPGFCRRCVRVLVSASEFMGVYQADSAPFDLLTVVGVAVELVNVELTGGAPGPD